MNGADDVAAGCELCAEPGGHLIAGSARWRVIRAEDASFPAFYRVVWNAHRTEFTDLGADERIECMTVVAAVESALRELLQPTKVNLASLGNAVAHVHWHVVARFDWDTHFPRPVWAEPMREVTPPATERLRVDLAQLDAAVAQRLDALSLVL